MQLSRKWRIFLLVVLVLLMELLVLWRPLLNGLGSYLILEETSRPGDVIVVLGCWEDTVVRARYAAELYRQGLAPRIFLPGVARVKRWEDLKGRGVLLPDQRQMLQEVLEAFGVPREALETVQQEVACTEDEARVTRKWLEERGYKVVLLVTSRYHSRRADIIFSDLLQGRAEVVSLPSPYDDFRPEGWWQRREDTKRVVFEYEKLLYYKLWR